MPEPILFYYLLRMTYGYIRVSTDKQTVKNQRFEIEKFCRRENLKIDGWIEETASGTLRPEKRELGALLSKIRENDLIICSELSRLGRSLFMISLYRKLKECDQATRNSQNNAGLMGIEIKDRTFGIIGTGAIGQRVADIAHAFGAKVLGYNRSHKASNVEYTDLDTLLSTSDIVSVHLPLTADTHHLLNAEKLSLMKKDAILINTARGGVIDNEALAHLLKEGKIAGAGIDVYDGEPPLPADYPLLSAPNTILAPHVGFDTEEAMKRRAVIVVDNLQSFIDGKQKNIIVK